MSEIVQTIKGSQAFTSSALGDTTVGASADIDIDNCVVMYTLLNGDFEGRAKRHQFQAELATVSTNVVIQWTRVEAANSKGGTLEWTVIEFEADSLGTQGIERGTLTNTTSNTSDTVNLAGVNTPSNSLIFVSATTDESNYYYSSAPVTFSTNVTLGDQLTFDYHATSGASDWQQAWQTVELLSADVSVQHGDNAFTDNESFTGFTAVTTLADSMVLQTGQAGGNTTGVRFMTRLEMTSTSNIEFDDCVLGSAVGNNVSYSIIEWLSDVTVEKGTVAITDTNTTPSTAPSFTELTFDQTAVMVGTSGKNNGYQTDTTGSDCVEDDAWASIVLDDPADSLTVTRSGSAENMEYAYNVIEFPIASAGGITTNLASKTLADQNPLTGLIATIDSLAEAGHPGVLGLISALDSLSADGQAATTGHGTTLASLVEAGNPAAIGVITALDSLIVTGNAPSLGTITAIALKTIGELNQSIGSGAGISTVLDSLTHESFAPSLGLIAGVDELTILEFQATVGAVGTLTTALDSLTHAGQAAAVGLINQLDSLTRLERAQILGLITSSAPQTVTTFNQNVGGAGLTTSLASLIVLANGAGVAVWDIGDALEAAYRDLGDAFCFDIDADTLEADLRHMLD